LKQVFLFILLLLCSGIKGQVITISGRLLDKHSMKPLSFANIQVNETTIGTTTNKTGCFNLKIPHNHRRKLITFFYLGYKPETKSINQIIKDQNVLLQQEDIKIGEIIIMPDSTLLDLLRKAYNKIPNNYPIKPTKLKGFYRESIKTNEKRYLYFAEAVIETYKSSYKFSEDNGQVKILKSLVNEFPNIDALGNTRFYGGIFTNEDDFVKKRKDFINPKKFDNYQYSVNITMYQNREVYIINFDTKNDSLKGTEKGKFYLDKSSLAYVGCEFESTKRGLKSYNLKNFSIETKKYAAKVFYIMNNNKWYLKYCYNDMLFEKKQQNFNISSECVTTKILKDTVKPIPFKERVEFGDVFSEKAKKYYSDDYWGEYNILKKDSLLNKQIEQLYDTIESKKLLTKKTSYTKKRNLLKIFSKLENVYGISYFPVYASKGSYIVNYIKNGKEVSFSEEINSFSYNSALSGQINYNLNYQWSINFMVYISLTKELYIKTYDIGSSYRILLNKRTKPLILKLSLLASNNNFARNFSTYPNNIDFEFGNKSIDAENLKFSIGFKTIGLKPKISLEYNLRRILWLTISADYYIPFYSKEKLFLKEKSGFFLTRKKANIGLSDNSLDISYNGMATERSHLNFDNYTISLGFMVKF